MTIIMQGGQVRRKNEHYETPRELVEAALDLLPSDFRPKRIDDPGAGSGVWGKVARLAYPHAQIVGIERYSNRKPLAYDLWYQENYLLVPYEPVVDLVIGNPPYGDVWEETQKKKKAEAKKKGRVYRRPPRPENEPMADAEAFVRHGWKSLKPGGYMVFLLRLAFLESQKRGEGLWVDIPPKTVYVLIERPSFTNDGKTDETAYGLYIWHKPKPSELDYDETNLDWLSWR